MSADVDQLRNHYHRVGDLVRIRRYVDKFITRDESLIVLDVMPPTYRHSRIYAYRCWSSVHSKTIVVLDIDIQPYEM
jgi:hypothetical protein